MVVFLQALADKLKAQLESVRKAKAAAGVKTTAAAERAHQHSEEKRENVSRIEHSC